MAAKAAAGYVGISLSREIGGQGRSPFEEIISYKEENSVFMGSCDESFGGNLVDMHCAGVEVRPLQKISGRADFNEPGTLAAAKTGSVPVGAAAETR